MQCYLQLSSAALLMQKEALSDTDSDMFVSFTLHYISTDMVTCTGKQTQSCKQPRSCSCSCSWSWSTIVHREAYIASVPNAPNKPGKLLCRATQAQLGLLILPPLQLLSQHLSVVHQ